MDDIQILQAIINSFVGRLPDGVLATIDKAGCVFYIKSQWLIGEKLSSRCGVMSLRDDWISCTVWVPDNDRPAIGNWEHFGVYLPDPSFGESITEFVDKLTGAYKWIAKSN